MMEANRKFATNILPASTVSRLRRSRYFPVFLNFVRAGGFALCWSFSGRLVLRPKNCSYGISRAKKKKKGSGQTVPTGPTQTHKRNHRENGANQDQRQTTKPQPQPDRARASQARMAFSSFWVGSALPRLAYSTRYPTG